MHNFVTNVLLTVALVGVGLFIGDVIYQAWRTHESVGLAGLGVTALVTVLAALRTIWSE